MNFIRVLETAVRDLHYSIRTFGKNPAFAGISVLTLAVAIGGNTAMFTVIHSVLLKPLAYREPEQLVRISGGATPVRFEEIKASARSFAGIGAFSNEEELTLTGGAEPEALSGARVSANFLEILVVRPILGRSFLPAEDAPNAVRVALISTGLWQRRFGRDPLVLGKTLTLGTEPYIIVGVLPPTFQFPYPGVEVWTTRPMDWPMMAAKSRALSPFLTIFGRIKPGVNLQQANAEMALVHHQYAVAHPTMLDAKSDVRELIGLKDQLVAQVGMILWMLFGAVCCVLLIACASVANLLLARSSSRAREFAIRSALGATKGRLASQLLAESVLLSSAGGLLGLWIAGWGVRAVRGITAFDLPRTSEIRLDWTVLGFVAALSLGTGLLFGLAPSLSAWKPDLMTALRARGGAANQGFQRSVLARFSLRSILVVAQIALSVMLLIGAALLFKSVVQLHRVNVGFNPANLLTLRVSLPPTRFDTDQKRASFYENVVRRLQRIPGVSDATAAMFLPMTGFVGSPVQDASKPPLKLNQRPIATILMVAPSYFRTLQISLQRGREFNEHDIEGTQRVAVIDESFARHFWPAYPSGQNPVGQRLLVGGLNAQPVEIVGIVADVHQNLENSAWPLTVYTALAQNPQQFAAMAVRTRGEASHFAKAVGNELRAVDRNQPLPSFRTMDDLIENEMGEHRLTMGLLVAFAGVALLLALIGIYGVIAYSVVQRTHEIGIRRALGAQRRSVLRLVVMKGFRLALTGAALGLIGAFGLTRLLGHLLFQVSATDPATFSGTALLSVIVALAASYIPAHRAAQIDPVQALQAE